MAKIDDPTWKIAVEARSLSELLAERFDRHLSQQDRVNEKLYTKIDDLKDIIIKARFEAKDADVKTNMKMYGIFSAIASAVYTAGEGIKHLFK